MSGSQSLCTTHRRMEGLMSAGGGSPEICMGAMTFEEMFESVVERLFDLCPQLCLVTGRSFGSNLGGLFKSSFFKRFHMVVHVDGSLPVCPRDADLQSFSAAGPDIGILAIGGGKIIDTAKLLSLGVPSGILFEHFVKNRIAMKRRYPLNVIPTTAGSGSEVTPFAVVYCGGKKFSVEHESILPDTYFLNPSLIATNSPYSLACSGLDAVSQSIEALLSKRKNDLSDTFALQSLSSGVTALVELVKDYSLECAERTMLASHFAGKAIAISRTTAPHALSYFFSSRYGVPHGHAVALSMGGYLQKFSLAVKSGELDAELWGESLRTIQNILEIGEGEEIRDGWRRYVHSLGITVRLSDLNIPYTALDELKSAINLQRLSNSPLELSLDHLHELFD